MIVPALLGLAALGETTPGFGNISNTSKNPPGIPTMPPGWSGAGPTSPGFDGDLSIRSRRGAESPGIRGPHGSASSGPFRVLTGLIAYADPKQGFAIIGNSVDNTFLVRPGQQLPDGSWIREVHAEHVVLEHGGNLEALRIHQRGESAGSAYIPIPPMPRSPLPQSARWEEPEGTTVSEAKSNPAESTDGSPGNSTPVNSPPGIPPPNDMRTKQAQPEAPVPQSQDPADAFGDDRRQRADSRKD